MDEEAIIDAIVEDKDKGLPPYELGESPSTAEIINYIQCYGLHVNNVMELVPKMLRSVCRDDEVDAVEDFIKAFDHIEWRG